MEYTGDQATVLPSNTPALLHFSDQFAELDKERQAKQLAMQKMDQDRRNKITTYLNGRLDGKDFNSNATYQGLVNGNLNDLYSKGVDMAMKGASLQDVAAFIEPQIKNLNDKVGKIKALDSNILSGATELQKQNPGLDMPALISLARHDATFQKDDQGNMVLKDPSTIDPDQNYVRQAYIDHYPLLYSPQASSEDLTKRFDTAKLADVNKDNAYDSRGNLISTGYKGKVPGFVNVTQDANGKPTVSVESQNYRLPGANTDYIDQEGQPVKVASDRVFSQFYNGALGAGIEKKVRSITDEAGLPPNSTYADMLRKKFLYDTLQGESAGRYKFTTPEDKSMMYKNQILGRDLQRAHLALSEEANAREAAKWNAEKAKIAAAGADNAVVPYTDQYEAKAKTFTNPIEGKTYKYIDTKDIDKKTLDLITGNKYNSNGDAATNNVQPFEHADGSGDFYLINDNGNWMGKGGQIIDRNAAYTRQLNYLKKGKEETAPETTPAETKTPNLLNASWWKSKFKGK